MRGRGAVGAAMGALWFAVAQEGAAFAQPAAAARKAEADPTAEAKQLYTDGVKEAAKGQWAKAHALFLEAFRLKQHFQIAVNLAQSELKLELYREAAEHIAFFLKEAQGVGKDERAKITAMFDEARRHIGTVHVEVDRVGAEIFVDGVAVGTSPLDREVFVAPGRRVIEARREGVGVAREARTVSEGGEVQVRLTLGNEEVGRTAAVMGTSDALEGGANKTVVIIGAVAAGVAAAAGVGFHVGAAVKLGERGDKPKDCRDLAACVEYNDAEAARWGLAVASVTGYIAAGVLGAGTLTYVLVKRAKEPQATARAGLILGPGAAGAMVTVHW